MKATQTTQVQGQGTQVQTTQVQATWSRAELRGMIGQEVGNGVFLLNIEKDDTGHYVYEVRIGEEVQIVSYAKVCKLAGGQSVKSIRKTGTFIKKMKTADEVANQWEAKQLNALMGLSLSDDLKAQVMASIAEQKAQKHDEAKATLAEIEEIREEIKALEERLKRLKKCYFDSIKEGAWDEADTYHNSIKVVAMELKGKRDKVTCIG